MAAFVAELLDSRSFFEHEGAGAIITIEEGREDLRTYPYKLQNIKRKGRCKTHRVIQLFLKSNNQLLAECKKKMEAIEVGKGLMMDYREDIYARTVYKSAEDDYDFIVKYVPSKKSKIGKYIVFGVDYEDVRIAKRKKRLNL